VSHAAPSTGSDDFLLLRNRPRHRCTLGFEGAPGKPPEKFTLRPDAPSLGAYEGAVLLAGRGPEADLERAMIAAAFAHLAIAEDGTKLEARLLALPTDAQVEAFERIRAWYEKIRPPRATKGEPGSDPTPASSASPGGPAAPSKRSRASRARSS